MDESKKGKSEEVGLRKSGKGPGNEAENKKNALKLMEDVSGVSGRNDRFWIFQYGKVLPGQSLGDSGIDSVPRFQFY